MVNVDPERAPVCVLHGPKGPFLQAATGISPSLQVFALTVQYQRGNRKGRREGKEEVELSHALKTGRNWPRERSQPT
jgi:hypothetical protein